MNVTPKIDLFERMRPIALCITATLALCAEFSANTVFTFLINDYIILLPSLLSNTAVATTEGLIPMDGTHFDFAGQRELGRLYTDAWH